MLSLNAKSNGARILFPREFLHPEVEEKYTRILKNKRSFFTRPIDFINETIQKVDVLGFTNGALIQRQTGRGEPIIDPTRIEENNFLHTQSDYAYRSEVSPLELVDKTLNVEFRHTLGYLNYIILFENFWYIYARDMYYKDMVRQFNIELFDELGEIFCKIIIDDPIINGMDLLSFDYTQAVTNPSSFKVEFKYSNFDFEFPDRYMDEDYVMPVNRDKIISSTGTSTTIIPGTGLNTNGSGNIIPNNNDAQIILDEC